MQNVVENIEHCEIQWKERYFTENDIGSDVLNQTNPDFYNIVYNILFEFSAHDLKHLIAKLCIILPQEGEHTKGISNHLVKFHGILPAGYQESLEMKILKAGENVTSSDGNADRLEILKMPKFQAFIQKALSSRVYWLVQKKVDLDIKLDLDIRGNLLFAEELLIPIIYSRFVCNRVARGIFPIHLDKYKGVIRLKYGWDEIPKLAQILQKANGSSNSDILPLCKGEQEK
jgi:hypothetical protein